MLVVILLVGSLIVVMGLLILFLLFMARRAKKETGAASSPAGNKAPTASPSKLLDIVKERYARGEITRDQYEQLRKDLS